MREIAERQGQRVVLWGSWGQNVGRTELLAGDPARAEQALRPCYDALREARQPRLLGDVAGQLAHALVELGVRTRPRPTQPPPETKPARPTSCSQVLWRSALARALADQGEIEEALDLVDEAVRLAGSTEWPNVIADALLDRARVRHVGRARARVDAERASVVYLAKANTAGLREGHDPGVRPAVARASHDERGGAQ